MRLSDKMLRRLEEVWFEATMGAREGFSAQPPSREERAAAVNACLGAVPLLIQEVQALSQNNQRLMREREQQASRIAELTEELAVAQQRLQSLEQSQLTEATS